MRHATRIGRLGMLAGELGIGAAMVSIPGVASADSSTDPFSWVDDLLSGLSVPAQTTSALDYQVSISGMDLFPTADNTATATSGTGSIAIAIGDGSVANASGGSLGSDFGTLDFAFADGTNSYANTSLGAYLDSAIADGTGSYATVGLGASLDNAIAVGTGSYADVGIVANDDTAFADGTGSYADAFAGNNDAATAIGDASRATASVGNQDVASAVSGGDANASGLLTTAIASGTNADAQTFGLSDLASAINTGSAFDQASANGFFDTAEVFGTGSSALAGFGGSSDLAAVFADMLDANATGANFLIDILPSL